MTHPLRRTPEEVRSLTREERAAIIDGAVDRIELARMAYEVAIEDIENARAFELTDEERFLADMTEELALLGLAKADAAFALASRVA
jgi:hypothetical protein